jgi:hypothetical protein
LNDCQKKAKRQAHGERASDHGQGDPDALQYVGQTLNNCRQSAVHSEPAHSKKKQGRLKQTLSLPISFSSPCDI